MKDNRLRKLAHRLMGERAMIPEGKCGKVAVEHEHHEAGDKLMLVNMRVAFFGGGPQQDYVCDAPTVTHRLTEDGGTWMTDLPCELVQMHSELARYARGRVLVGGLGLGILPRMLLNNRAVTSVTVVERSADVVSLVAPTLDCERLSVVVQDIADLDVKRREYDSALLDTWQGTGEMTWASEVVPLRRKLARKVGRIKCWQEQTMMLQVSRSIFAAAAGTSDYFASGACAPQYAFVRCLETLKVKRAMLPQIDSDERSLHQIVDYERCRTENVADPTLRSFASLFLHGVGTRDWETFFGRHWDAVYQQKEAA